MTASEIKAIVLEALHRVAPEADPDHLDPDIPFRDQIDFDSIDFVNLMEQLQEALDRKIPEIDDPLLTTLNGCLTYLR